MEAGTYGQIAPGKLLWPEVGGGELPMQAMWHVVLQPDTGNGPLGEVLGVQNLQRPPFGFQDPRCPPIEMTVRGTSIPNF
jgi:hypothetical protein